MFMTMSHRQKCTRDARLQTLFWLQKHIHDIPRGPAFCTVTSCSQCRCLDASVSDDWHLVQDTVVLNGAATVCLCCKS